MMRRKSACLALAVLAAAPAHAACLATDFDGVPLTRCHVTAGDDLRLFLSDAAGQPYGSFPRVAADLAARGERLVFAMNAGMYHRDRSPVGLFIDEGAEVTPLVSRPGPGNFGMVPNGVFCVGDTGFAVVETLAFAANPPACRFATQSGPMLVIDGALHPRFLPDSDSLNIRNGVGVSDDGREAWFVISNAPVTFHRFARYFREALGVSNALYLDGSISRLYAPEVGRDDWGLPLGPILGLVVPAG